MTQFDPNNPTAAEEAKKAAEAQADTQAQAEFDAQQAAQDGQEFAQDAASAESADAQAEQEQAEQEQAEQAQAEQAEEDAQPAFAFYLNKPDYYGAKFGADIAQLEKLAEHLEQVGFDGVDKDEVFDTLSGYAQDLVRVSAHYDNFFERSGDTYTALKHQLAESKVREERLVRDNQAANKYANEKLIKNVIVPLFTNLDLAGQHLKRETPALVAFGEDLDKFEEEFLAALAKNHIELYGEKGDVFDPQLHDALSVIPAMPGTEPGSVAFVARKGFKLHDRVVVPAQVMAVQADD